MFSSRQFVQRLSRCLQNPVAGLVEQLKGYTE